MADQLTTSAEALRLFFTDDVYFIQSDTAIVKEAEPVIKTDETVTVAAIPPVVTADTPPSRPLSGTPEPSTGTASPVPADVATIFKYLGKNQKNVLILVNDGENEVSSEGGRELLRNLVKAIQLTANDFALLNYYHYQQTGYEELRRFFNSRVVLGFGVTPVQLGLQEQAQHGIGQLGEVQLVFSGRLDLLAADQDGKKKLWGSLKQLNI